MKYLTLLLLVIPTLLFGQENSGYYMNWNRDHTGRTIKPMIPVTKAEANKVNCYLVEFDDKNRFKSVKYYNSGKPSKNSSYGAHELVRIYTDLGYEDEFKEIGGSIVLNSSGIKKYEYKLDDQGHWIEIRNLDLNGELAEENGVSIIRVKRDYRNRILTEIQLNLKNDTIPDPNDFKIVHFTYDQNSYMTSRQNKDEKGMLKNGKHGYAKVIFQFDHNGMFYGEEFLNSEEQLTIHPNIGYAKIDFRDFNKFGKSLRQYYSDEDGYPNTDISMGEMSYNENMSRRELIFYNRIGEKSEDNKGIAKTIYEYNGNGKLVRRKYLNIKGAEIE